MYRYISFSSGWGINGIIQQNNETILFLKLTASCFRGKAIGLRKWGHGFNFKVGLRYYQRFLEKEFCYLCSSTESGRWCVATLVLRTAHKTICYGFFWKYTIIVNGSIKCSDREPFISPTSKLVNCNIPQSLMMRGYLYLRRKRIGELVFFSFIKILPKPFCPLDY